MSRATELTNGQAGTWSRSWHDMMTKARKGSEYWWVAHFPLILHFLSNMFSWWYKPCASASSLSHPPVQMNTLKMLLRRSSFSSSLHIDRIIVQQQIPDQINFKMFFECLMYMELGAVGVGVRWKPSLYTRGYCVLVPYFVFRASWVSWTMKRKCLLSWKKSLFIWPHQWPMNLSSGGKLLRAGKISVLFNISWVCRIVPCM